MTKKYLVVPGMEMSKNDKQWHYISFSQLCRLYGVNPAECVDGSREERLRGRDTSNLIVLGTLYHGNYNELKNKIRNGEVEVTHAKNSKNSTTL